MLRPKKLGPLIEGAVATSHILLMRPVPKGPNTIVRKNKPTNGRRQITSVFFTYSTYEIDEPGSKIGFCSVCGEAP